VSILSSIRESELKGARVIVTGASGFIGLNLVRELMRLGASVMVIDRIQPSERVPGVEFEWADLRHLDQIYEADFLIHLAAITNAGYAERHPLDTYEVNVLGTVNLLNHVKIKNRVLFPSTALVYRASELPLSENAETELSATYALSKNIGESVVKSLCGRMGVDYTIVRFFNVYGPGQLPMYIVPQVLRQTAEEHRVEVRNGSVQRDLLFVDDCIEAVLKLVVTAGAANSTFNIGSGEMVSILDVAKAAVAASGDHTVEIVDQQQNIEYSPTAIMADIGKVKSTIDWHPRTNLTEGMARMWEAMKGEK
jgi:UDP-glucose 4-epimerase